VSLLPRQPSTGWRVSFPAMATIFDGVLFTQSLQDLVKGIRAHRRDEADYIRGRISDITVECRSSEPHKKANGVLKLTYVRSSQSPLWLIDYCCCLWVVAYAWASYSPCVDSFGLPRCSPPTLLCVGLPCPVFVVMILTPVHCAQHCPGPTFASVSKWTRYSCTCWATPLISRRSTSWR